MNWLQQHFWSTDFLTGLLGIFRNWGWMSDTVNTLHAHLKTGQMIDTSHYRWENSDMYVDSIKISMLPLYFLIRTRQLTHHNSQNKVIFQLCIIILNSFQTKNIYIICVFAFQLYPNLYFFKLAQKSYILTLILKRTHGLPRSISKYVLSIWNYVHSCVQNFNSY